MPTFRSGLLLAVLLLSACSMPILQDSQQTKTEKPITQNKATTEQTKTPKDSVDEIVNTVVKNDSANKTDAVDKTDDHNLAEQLDAQKKLANANFKELQNRVGNAPELPRILASKQLSTKEIDSAIQQLRSYISKTNGALASLNARVDDREKVAISGDLIQIFLSDTTVTHKSTTFKAQPLVGQWIRGESRVIRLKDNILFENPKSEDLHITFSETYQLVVNGVVISTVNPNKEKNNANFNVSTFGTEGKIVGKLDYRVVNNK